MSETTYIISGKNRTGTSMMMRCCELGGMECHYDKEREPQPVLNEFGNYEMSGEQRGEAGLWVNHGGEVIKALVPRVFQLPHWGMNYKICFMTRHPWEVRESCKAVIPHAARYSDEDYYKQNLESLCVLSLRPNVEITVLDYDRVLSYPTACFTALEERGWPIKRGPAVGGVCSELRRFNSKERVDD